LVRRARTKEEAMEMALKPHDVKSVDRLTIAAAEDDAEIGRQVADRIRRYVLYSIYDDVNVGVRWGVVTLTGRVTMGYKAHDLAEIASKVLGVQTVKNEIHALPLSIFDEEVRAAVASQIYRDPAFSEYAFQTSPPIHIVVENGNVSLTGAVGSEVERARAGLLARGVFGVMSVDNQLRIAA
jgi:osmotically-inducible protein OsmY